MDIDKTNKMIKATELRIGNILAQGTVLEIFVDGLTIQHIDENGIGMITQVLYNDVSEIKLTPEILVKAGFEHYPNFTVGNSMFIDVGRKRQISVSCIGTPNFTAWLQEIDGNEATDLVCIHNWDYDKEMYLHQLQNLYYAITGKELNITL